MQHISWTYKIILKIYVLWDVVPCCLVDTYNYFGGLAAPIFRVQEFFYPKEGCRKYSETWVHIHIRLHDITSQKTVSQESQISQNNTDHHHGLIKHCDLEFGACINFPEV